ncbi:MAG: hypothetical protein JWO56_1279 [Acidobacteria bacterium]|nr:hypothetical protein [Acidobacteriota bacterium]
MKTLALTATLLASTALFAAAAAKPANYAGKWTLDQSKSRNLPRYYTRIKSHTLNIAQDAATLDVGVEVAMGDQAPDKLDFHYKLDGSETKSESTIRMPGGPVKTPVALKAVVSETGGLAITIDRELPNKAGHATTNEEWELSPDGKTLTVHRTDVAPLGKQESEMVFVKG